MKAAKARVGRLEVAAEYQGLTDRRTALARQQERWLASLNNDALGQLEAALIGIGEDHARAKIDFAKKFETWAAANP